MCFQYSILAHFYNESEYVRILIYKGVCVCVLAVLEKALA